MPIDLIKAHAYGNDFLFAPIDQTVEAERATLAQRVCDRHTGVGADGLVLYALHEAGATMSLFNADGGVAEVSGNAVRCLAAIVTRARPSVTEVVIETDAGEIPLTLVESAGDRLTFEAMMGQPTGLRQRALEAAGETVEVAELSVGNPQCIVLQGPVDEARLHRLGPVLATHPVFPSGSNVELVEVESSSRIRILIWERGVGPTAASGTGACASAVAAAAFGGASRDVDVVSPGGTQHVTWTEAGMRLTGWAEVVLTGRWHG
ncbi:MAG: diaminopimelate epimerase [Acidobacteria bacterium]|jgi:diaminopimelate epimerase|nr:diaminopimelate epimerase [Acidobacteriota bacterium]MDP7479905.1 diaminopimelate epimerase [Vicinamibacterales bacterium]MDP7693060.1 diaminopimelate epimerase [Vicinamibacterales bacterium]HJN45960.1 diaminopimelate epimerase [Vicinamibacterales bacterium]|tara:strand:+ start:561 stop:1349 length:789 start_codon:yes stop_codon:yes gene_type:complete